MKVYLDNAATTPMYDAVIEEMSDVMRREFGNPSSIHRFGRSAKNVLEEARKLIAGQINASIGEIIFTSGGTESNNMALKCSVRDLGVRRIITSPIEHHCILHSCERLEAEGVEIALVNVLSDGAIDLEHLNELLSSSSTKTLVSLMHANNEIGTLLDLERVSDLCTTHSALFHTDTVQTIAYMPPDVSKINISFLSGSAHKFYGPKGVGFLYMNANNIVKPYIDGGAQERNMRAGTENFPGIVGMKKALELVAESREAVVPMITALRNKLWSGLKQYVPSAVVNGRESGDVLPTVLNVHFPEHPKSSMLLMYLDIKGIAASGGSACSSGANHKSHVIENIHPGREGGVDIRFSLSSFTTDADIEYTIETIRDIYSPTS